MQAEIAQIHQYQGQKVEIKGWLVHRTRKGKIIFLTLRDGSGFIQATLVQNQSTPELFELADHLAQETSLIAEGEVRPDPRAPGGYEISLSALQLIAQPEAEYPITPKEHGIDFLLDNRHLWLRHRGPWATLRVRDCLERATHEFFHRRGFIRFDAPILTASAAEGSTDLFEVDLFDGESAYLAQTGQLYAEAGALAFGKVYTFGPTFRAERSKTRRHLLEFWMVEPEVAFLDHEGNLKLQEDYVSYLVQRALEECSRELEILGRDLKTLEAAASTPYPRLDYDQAIEILNSKGEKIAWGEDFGAPHETLIAQDYQQPVFICRYPAEIKAFYMQPDPTDPRKVLNDDLIAPQGYGEIIGGSERIHDPELLRQKIAQHGLSEEIYSWYLDLRRYGSVPHSGFGLGLERAVTWITGGQHLREAIPFARLYTRMRP